MDRVLHFILAIVVVAILALLVSHNRKQIRIRYVIQLLVIEVLLAWFFLNSDIGLGFVKGFSEMFEKLLGFANEGTNFVFGNMNDKGLAFFFLKVLCPIVFISALIGILQHIRILPIVIRAIGTVLSKINGMGKLESFNAVSSLILGQSENFIAYKDILGKMSRNRMYTMAATAMSTVSMSIVGAYMTMLQPKYVVAALVLNMFSTFIVLSLINPYRVDESEENLQMSNLHEGQSFFEMLGEYILAGFKVAIIVAAMLIGFIALISGFSKCDLRVHSNGEHFFFTGKPVLQSPVFRSITVYKQVKASTIREFVRFLQWFRCLNFYVSEGHVQNLRAHCVLQKKKMIWGCLYTIPKYTPVLHPRMGVDVD